LKRYGGRIEQGIKNNTAGTVNAPRKPPVEDVKEREVLRKKAIEEVWRENRTGYKE